MKIQKDCQSGGFLRNCLFENNRNPRARGGYFFNMYKINNTKVKYKILLSILITSYQEDRRKPTAKTKRLKTALLQV